MKQTSTRKRFGAILLMVALVAGTSSCTLLEGRDYKVEAGWPVSIANIRPNKSSDIEGYRALAFLGNQGAVDIMRAAEVYVCLYWTIDRRSDRWTDAVRCTYRMLNHINVSGWVRPFWDPATSNRFTDWRETFGIVRQHPGWCQALKVWLTHFDMDWVPHKPGTYCRNI